MVHYFSEINVCHINVCDIKVFFANVFLVLPELYSYKQETVL